MTFDEKIAVKYSQEFYEEMADASMRFPSFASEHEGYGFTNNVIIKLSIGDIN